MKGLRVWGIRLFSNRAVQLICLLAIGALLLFLRNSSPMMQAAMYTEDGGWLGSAFTRGWPSTLLNAKSEYFVWGNLLLLWFSSLSSLVVCGDKLICLPQSVAVFSYLFFSATATASWHVTKSVLPLFSRWILFFLILLIPLGDSSNEVLGRISNIGFSMILWDVLLVFYRERIRTARQSRLWILCIDLALLLTAATNPLCFVIIPVICGFSLLFEKPRAHGFFQFIRHLWHRYSVLFLGLAALLIAQLIYFSGDKGVIIKGAFNSGHLIEIVIARSLLYPIIFRFYTLLTDAYILGIFAIAIALLVYLIFHTQKHWQAMQLIGMTVVSLCIFLPATIYARPFLTQSPEIMGAYATTFPDRYYMGLNLLVIFMAVVVLGSVAGNRQVVFIKRSLLLGICVLYLTSLGWLFEFNQPRLLVTKGPTFNELICLTTQQEIESEVVDLPIYFEGWNMLIPAPLLKAASQKLDCSKINDVLDTQFYAQGRFYLTDENWTHGVSKHSPSFFVPNVDEMIELYQVGKRVQFQNGEIRQIVNVASSGMYLNVTVEGGILNPEAVGVPSSYEVLN